MSSDHSADCEAIDVPDAVTDASAIEQADVEVAKAVAPYRNSRTVRALGQLSELADQPPLIAICSATLAWGLLSGNRRLARAGARMLAAELAATAIKSVVKRSVDRTRPKLLVEEGRYELSAGTASEGPINSFPSGHTAGAVTVARAFARDYPEHTTAAYAIAAAAAAIQVPRCTHYPTDIAAGTVVGWVAEIAVSAALDAMLPADQESVEPPATAPTGVSRAPDKLLVSAGP
jgi:membrane-associated phospholipid phosphatase